MAVIRAILFKEPKERSSQEIKQVQKRFKDNKFFQTVLKERDEKTFFELCERLRLEEYSQSAIVFNYGDIGQLFYIVVEGEVDVKVPSPVILEEDSATPEGLISFIMLYFNDLHWERLYMGKRIIQLIFSELRACDVEVGPSGTFDTKTALEAIDQRITKQNTNIHFQVYKLVNPESKDRIELHWFKTVSKLGGGTQFGDLALQYNQPRGATIQCTQRTLLATLSRTDYSLIIGKEQKRKMKQIVDEVKNYRIFQTLRPTVIVKIFHYMEKVEFQRGHTLYSEGVSKTDAVYFVIEGEFAVTKAAQSNNDVDEMKLKDMQDSELPISRKVRKSPTRTTKVREMLVQRNINLLGNSVSGMLTKEAANKFVRSNRGRTIQLYLLGKNEIFGMEEIVQILPLRNFTIKCASMKGICYKITKDAFQDCVNQFRFSDAVV